MIIVADEEGVEPPRLLHSTAFKAGSVASRIAHPCVLDLRFDSHCHDAVVFRDIIVNDLADVLQKLKKFFNSDLCDFLRKKRQDAFGDDRL